MSIKRTARPTPNNTTTGLQHLIAIIKSRIHTSNHRITEMMTPIQNPAEETAREDDIDRVRNMASEIESSLLDIKTHQKETLDVLEIKNFGILLSNIKDKTSSAHRKLADWKKKQHMGGDKHETTPPEDTKSSEVPIKGLPNDMEHATAVEELHPAGANKEFEATRPDQEQTLPQLREISPRPEPRPQDPKTPPTPSLERRPASRPPQTKRSTTQRFPSTTTSPVKTTASQKNRSRPSNSCVRLALDTTNLEPKTPPDPALERRPARSHTGASRPPQTTRSTPQRSP